MEKDELLNYCNETQVGNPKSDSRVRKRSDEIGLEYIWSDREGRDLKNTCQIIRTRSNDIQRQSEKMKEKIFSLIL